MSWRIGIDVGGTHTDAALLDDRLECIATVKVPTTVEVMSGIRAALLTLLDRAGAARDRINYAMLGTTHCTNALVERRDLQPVGLLRLARPASLAVPPMSGWPEDLARAIDARVEIVQGGYEYDGSVLAELDEAEIRAVARSWRGTVEGIAICGMFSPINAAQERRVADWLCDELGDAVGLSLSSEIGNIGLLERESATLLNAALGRVANRVADGFRNALGEAELGHARSLISQNDGTLMSIEAAQAYPVLTMGCGPTNSLRGAAFLSGRRDGVVVDIGGTTSDIGILVNGFPRQSARAVEIGGVRTNFHMPDILSIGIGGGTVVRESERGVRLGPDSVGYRLTELAQCFGGDTLTLTDVALALGVAPPFAPDEVRADRTLCHQAFTQMMARLEEGIDRMKTHAADVPVIVVGGGSVLVPNQINGASEVIRPPHFGAANAIGVAIGSIGSEIDRVVALPADGRQAVLAKLQGEASTAAVAMGADPDQLEIIEQDVIPLAYLQGDAARVRIKVAGPLCSGDQSTSASMSAGTSYSEPGRGARNV